MRCLPVGGRHRYEARTTKHRPDSRQRYIRNSFAARRLCGCRARSVMRNSSRPHFQQSSLHHLRSATEFTRLLRSTPAACDALLEAVLAGDTNFFAHPVVFEALRNQALPEILQRKERERPSSLRIWSAGCGSGEEAYSIALTLCEALNGSGVSWNIHIVASDIRRAALKPLSAGSTLKRNCRRYPDPGSHRTFRVWEITFW